MKYSLKSLLLLALLVALGTRGVVWWNRVSEEQRWLREFDPSGNHIFDYEEGMKRTAMVVFEDLKAELRDAAYFGTREQKLAICHRHAAELEKQIDEWYHPELGRAFEEVAHILELPPEDIKNLTLRLRYDSINDRNIWPW